MAPRSTSGPTMPVALLALRDLHVHCLAPGGRAPRAPAELGPGAAQRSARAVAHLAGHDLGGDGGVEGKGAQRGLVHRIHQLRQRVLQTARGAHRRPALAVAPAQHPGHGHARAQHSANLEGLLRRVGPRGRPQGRRCGGLCRAGPCCASAARPQGAGGVRRAPAHPPLPHGPQPHAGSWLPASRGWGQSPRPPAWRRGALCGEGSRSRARGVLAGRRWRLAGGAAAEPSIPRKAGCACLASKVTHRTHTRGNA